jgi:hypothetical protein
MNRIEAQLTALRYFALDGTESRDCDDAPTARPKQTR